MKLILSLAFIILSMSITFAQDINSLAGIWKISPVKILTLNIDQSFSYKKGAKLFEGTYEIKKDGDQSLLIMHFTTEVMEYVIEDVTKQNFKLIDIKNGRELNAKLIESFTENKVAQYEERLDENVNSNESTEYVTNDYQKTESPQSVDENYPSYIFTLFGGASLSSAKHPNLSESNFTFAGVNNKTEYRSTLGFQTGLNLSFKIVDGLYIGSGVEASKIGFIEYLELSDISSGVTDQTLVFLESKYSVIGIHIPLYIDIMAYKGIRIKGKFFASKFLSNTSKAYLNIEGNYTSSSTNENDTFYADEGSVKHPDIVSSFSYGLGLELQYYFTNKLGISLSYSVYKNYIELNQRDIDNQTLGANIKYSF
ncbi:MAG: hypothetical protein ACI86M_002094 [Saprospiraceae bacterium]|jgi:hypothetical protein